MATDHILALLVSERDKLTRAIEALQRPTKRQGRPAGSGRRATVPSVRQDTKVHETAAPKAPAKAPAKRKLSAAGRKAIIAAAEKRWAAIKAAKSAVAGSVAATPKAEPAKARVAGKQKRSPARDAAFRKKMSERMKAAWARRRKRPLREVRPRHRDYRSASSSAEPTGVSFSQNSTCRPLTVALLAPYPALAWLVRSPAFSRLLAGSSGSRSFTPSTKVRWLRS